MINLCCAKNEMCVFGDRCEVGGCVDARPVVMIVIDFLVLLGEKVQYSIRVRY